ncbi:MAG: glycosyltransferase family 39 protein, partial [Acidobacteria bacterium]|nr:glycosyltransferase family 39 protein [Acidobacteriota bacterium]
MDNVVDAPSVLQTTTTPVANAQNRTRSARSAVLIFAVILLAVLTLHLPLVSLPYVWDEAGYYIPAARDLLVSGHLIPHSTTSNAHPPLVIGWLAIFWKLAGFRPVVSRVAMLLIAAFTLLGVFRLAALLSNPQIAIASTVCTGLYPVFFAQSSLAHLDMAAAGLTLWGVAAYIERRQWSTLAWFSLAGLAKETAIVTPLAISLWELARPARRSSANDEARLEQRPAFLAAALVPLGAWFAYHYMQTGYVFGNPEFFHYNVIATLRPWRVVLAAAMRVWQMVGYMHLWLLTLAGALAMFLPPQREGCLERPRIARELQALLLVLVLAYVLTMATIGGAVLARYMLPVLPLVIILWVSTLWRRAEHWLPVIVLIGTSFIVGWFVNPPYGFPFEDNLAYRDYIVLHRTAEQFLAKQRPGARVLTAWPASDELTRPYLGYVSAPLRVVQVDDFSFEQMVSASDASAPVDLALVFSTKYQPAHPILNAWQGWDRIKRRYFGYHQDLLPAVAAEVLHGNVIYSAARNGQWIGIIEIQPIMDAGELNLPLKGAADDRSAFSRSAIRLCQDTSRVSREQLASTAPAFVR